MLEVVLIHRSPANEDKCTGPVARETAGPIYIQAVITGEEIIGELGLEVSADNLNYIPLEETIKEVSEPGNFSWDGVSSNAKYVRLRWKYEGGEGEISASANI